jgi:AsmA protein
MRVVLVVAVVLAAILAVVPFFVQADRFRPLVEAQMSTALGRPVQMGHLSLSLFSGGLVARQIAIADDPSFSRTPALSASELRIGVRLGPLLFHRRLSVTSLTIESPSMQFLETDDGRWNFSSLGGSAPKPANATPTAGSVPAFSVDELKIVKGRATLSRQSSNQPPLEITGINLTVRNLSLTSSAPFQLTAQLSGGGALQADGTAGPVAENNAEMTPFQARFQLKHFDVEKFGGLLAQSGLAGLLDLDAQVVSQAGQVSLKGKLKGEHLKLVRNGMPAREPVEVDYALNDNLLARSVQIDDVALHAGSVAAHVSGSLATTAAATQVNLKLSAHEMPIDGLENLLPAVGIVLPRGSQLRGGTLSADFTVTGSAEDTVIAGPVVVSNTVLAGYDLGAHIGGINPFGGSGAGTKVQTLRADLKVTPQAEQLSNIYADLPQVGTATGSGTVSARQELDFQLVAKFNPTTGVGMVLGKGVNAVTSLLGKATHSKAGDGVPVTVQGTASDPQIHAHLGEMFKPQLGGKKQEPKQDKKQEKKRWF